MNKYMILLGGSPALHKLGDIGRRPYDDRIRVFEEDDTYYIGNFSEGLGFVDVKFKKEDCRNLTKEEVDDLNGLWFGINGRALYQITIDYEGNVIQKEVVGTYETQ